MNVPARMTGNETPHGLGLVRGVVVHHQMEVKVAGNAALNRPQEGQEFLAAMPWQALPDDRTGGHVKGCGQRRGAVALVIVDASLCLPRSHGHHRLGALQSLNLAFSSTHKTRARSGDARYRPSDSGYSTDWGTTVARAMRWSFPVASIMFAARSQGSVRLQDPILTKPAASRPPRRPASARSGSGAGRPVPWFPTGVAT